MSKVHIPVEANFGFTTKRKGMVIIDRASKTIQVKARYSKDEFILPLDEVVDMIMFKLLQSKALEDRQTKKRRARKVSRGLLSIGLR